MAAKQLKASIIIDLGGNVAQKAGQFSNAISRMVQRNSSTIRSFNTDIKALSSNIDKMGSRAIMGAAAIGYAFNKSFIKTAATFEDYHVQANSLFGGPAQGKKVMQWAQKNAKDTSLSLEQVMQQMMQMKAFGMNPMGGKLNIMEDVMAQRGWNYDKMNLAMTQLEQMHARQKITDQDANALYSEGLDVYKELAIITGKSESQIRALGSKGLLRSNEIELVFKQLGIESKGAATAGMNRFNQMISNLGDDWTTWQENVMNRGTFNKLENKIRQFKTFIENPDKANSVAHNTAAILNHSIDMATASAEGLWDVFKGIGNTVTTISDDIGKAAAWMQGTDGKEKDKKQSTATPATTLNGVKYLTEGLATAWLANKAIRTSYSLGKGVFKTGKWGYKAVKGTVKGGIGAGRWSWRKAFGGKRPQVENEIPGSGAGSFPVGTDKVMRVFVTNWPASGFGGSDFDGFGGDGKKSRRKKGPGKGRGRFSRVIGAGEEVLEDAEHVAGKKGFWNRTKSLFRGAGRFVTSMPWVANIANRSGQFSDALPASGMSRFKSLFSGAGRLAKAMPWAGAALAAADVATATNNTQRGAAIGGSAGAWIGGALGTLTDEFTGPFGTIVGEQLGQSLGDKLGAMLGSLFDDKKDTQTAQQQQPVTGRIDLNLNLPDGVTVGSSVSSFGGFNPINLMTGGYIPS
ncbi:TPA: tape measure protein [Salmonella enterica subsp. enterica serovar Infantis]|nr:tape measure protein [Salmonella enterica subsp. enterica serovar Infantis]HCJ0429083.1 tape measure protein [Salmonella enterica subsp. enterica serovar Infantis]